jgi:hypothetical protein
MNESAGKNEQEYHVGETVTFFPPMLTGTVLYATNDVVIMKVTDVLAGNGIAGIMLCPIDALNRAFIQHQPVDERGRYLD